MHTSMRILVQKFGGTSVATPEARELVYEKIIRAHNAGYSLVVVISAMGRRGAPYATDTLLDLILTTCPKSRAREHDAIYCCGETISGSLVTASIQQRGYRATYLTGQQAGLITTANFGAADLLEVEPSRILALLLAGEIVVVGGGQGASPTGELTTLGRGGSDTTACALGTALNADAIEIYTDVDGVMTADPRLVPSARLLPQLSYRDCIQLAHSGAKVMHPRSVELAAVKPEIPLWVKSTFNEHQGTLISQFPYPSGTRTNLVLALAVANGLDLFITAAGSDLPAQAVPNCPELMTAQALDQNATITLTRNCDAQILAESLERSAIAYQRKGMVSQISLIGHVHSPSELAVKIAGELTEAGIPVLAIIGGSRRTGVMVAEDQAVAAATYLHRLLIENEA